MYSTYIIQCRVYKYIYTYIFVNCNQNKNQIDEYGDNIRVELLGIVTWFQVDSDLGTEIKE